MIRKHLETLHIEFQRSFNEHWAHSGIRMILLKIAWIVIWVLPMTKESSEAQIKSETLLTTIKSSWTNLVKKINELEYIKGPWTSGTHPFNFFKYKMVTRPLTFPAATRNCEGMSGYLMYGDADLAKYIPDLDPNNKVWYSTKDTRPVTAMKADDIQDFVDNIGTCYTISKTNPPEVIAAHEERCDQKHVSICIKMLEKPRESFTYKEDVEFMKKLGPKMSTEDKALVDTLQRLLNMGKPATDQHHPVGLGQTIRLMTSMDRALSSLDANIPVYPEKDTLLEEVYNIRNTAHTTMLMVMAQHLENYASKIDTLIEVSHTHPSTTSEGHEDQNSGLAESPETETSQEFQITLDIKMAMEDIAFLKERIDQINNQATKDREKIKRNENREEKLELTTALANNNKRKIKTVKENIRALSTRLNEWIQAKIEQSTTTDQEEDTENEEECK